MAEKNFATVVKDDKESLLKMRNKLRSSFQDKKSAQHIQKEHSDREVF